MAQARFAQVIASERVNDRTVRLTCAMPEDDPLEFVGGQYLIVDSGRTLANGKAAKRAYSMLSPDEQRHQFQLAVYRVPDGPGSGHMHELRAGDPLQFSGPWGKKFHAAAVAADPVWVIATDTGITAGLGLMRSGQFAPHRGASRLIWLTRSEDYFLTRPVIEQSLPEDGPALEVQRLPAIHEPGRAEVALRWLEREISLEPPGMAYLVGDGDVVHPLRDRLMEAGLSEQQVPLETYFNHRAKKSV